MQCATCGAIKATILCKEAIAIRASTPSKAHIRAYMIAVDGKPSGTQTPPLEGEENHNPYPGGETLHHLQAALGDLADQEIQQLLEDFCWNVALHGLNAPPSSPPPMLWRNPTRNRDPDANDQEVTFLRGGGWVPPGQPFKPSAPTQSNGGWAPQGPPPQVVSLRQPF